MDNCIIDNSFPQLTTPVAITGAQLLNSKSFRYGCCGVVVVVVVVVTASSIHYSMSPLTPSSSVSHRLGQCFPRMFHFFSKRQTNLIFSRLESLGDTASPLIFLFDSRIYLETEICTVAAVDLRRLAASTPLCGCRKRQPGRPRLEQDDHTRLVYSSSSYPPLCPSRALPPVKPTPNTEICPVSWTRSFSPICPYFPLRVRPLQVCGRTRSPLPRSLRL